MGFLRILAALSCLAVLTTAQSVTGRISGTVTDSTGGVVAEVRVILVNQSTQLARTVTTSEAGFFSAPNLPVGNYTVTVEKEGFRKVVRSGIDLSADARLTENFTLEPGAIAQSVEVVASGETVNTTSGEISRVVDGKQVESLALNGRNYLQLVSLIPGAALLDENQLELTVNLSTTQQAVNGNRGNTSNMNVDGGVNQDSGSNNSQINNVGVDFIEEVSIKTSNFSAEFGRQSGASINVVTKSGGNRLRGSVFEYFRNNKLDARQTVAPRVGKLRFNDFGFSIGGPVKKDKFFFFAGMEWKYIRRDTDAVRRTIPTRAERQGDFSGRTGTLNLPGTTTPVPNRNIASLMTADGKAIAKVFDFAERVASSYVDTPTTNNATFQNPNPFNWREDIVRVDYRFNPSQTVYVRYLHDHFDLVEPGGTFINSQIPTVPTNRLRPGYTYQVAHTWLVSTRLINEAKFNTSWNGQRIPPVGDAWKRSTYGFTFPQLFPGGPFSEGIPNVSTLSGFATFQGPSGALLSPTTDIAGSDSVTWTRGTHSIKTGVIVLRNRKDQNGRTAYNGTLNFSTAGNTRTTGNAFADALLGNFRTYGEADADPLGFFRFWQVEAYVSDSWKVHRRLSLEMGVRYTYEPPIYTQANNVVNFDPRLYNPAQEVRVNANGTLVPGVGNRFNGLIRAGDGVPVDEQGRVSGATSAQVLAVPTGAPRGLYPTHNLWAPRFGFAWLPLDQRTVVRGGFGIFYDRPEGNIIFSSINVPPFLNTVQYENGNLANPAGGTASALAPFDTINTIDPKLNVPYTMNFSLGVQRQLPRGMFLEVAYVSNKGRHLIRQPDINQAPFAVLASNAALPTAQRLSVNALRPFKGYSAIRQRLSDSTSNYDSLQIHATKRKGRFTMTASYTWAKVLTDSNSNTDNPDEYTNRHFNYGPASFDRRHALVISYVYGLPRLGGWHPVARTMLGDWEISGITRAQSGAYFTATGNTSIGTRRADYVGGPVALSSDDRSLERWFNSAAFVTAPDTRLGTAGVGTIQGPGLYTWDLSVRKAFRLPHERMRVQFQADFFNFVNRANLRLGTTTTTSGGYGSIGTAGPARNIQFGLRFTF